MNTLTKGKTLSFDDQYLHVELDDGSIISTPMIWYEELQHATIAQILNYRLICANIGIEWPDPDYHLSIESMMAIAIEQRAA